MLSCAICRFEAPSDKHLRVHIKTKHDDRVLTCEKCELTCKGGRKLIDTHGFVQGIYLQTLWEKIHTIVGAVTWQSVLVLKRQSNVKIALVSSTQRVIWKFTWLTKVVKSNATSVIKHWNVKVFEKAHLIYTHRVQTEVVKTSEGHIGLFPSTELRKDLHCSFCDFIASIASKLKRHMVKTGFKLMVTLQSGCVIEILTLCRIDVIFF